MFFIKKLTFSLGALETMSLLPCLIKDRSNVGIFYYVLEKSRVNFFWIAALYMFGFSDATFYKPKLKSFSWASKSNLKLDSLLSSLLELMESELNGWLIYSDSSYPGSALWQVLL